MMGALNALAKFKVLRGTPLDIFGYTDERKMERQMIADFEALLGRVAGKLNAANAPAVAELLAAAEKIRGFGHVKEKAAKEVLARMAEMEREIDSPKRRSGGCGVSYLHSRRRLKVATRKTGGTNT